MALMGHLLDEVYWHRCCYKLISIFAKNIFPVSFWKTPLYFSMSDNLDDACKNLRLGLDNVRVNKSLADERLRPSQRKDFERIMGFTLYVSLRAVVN